MLTRCPDTCTLSVPILFSNAVVCAVSNVYQSATASVLVGSELKISASSFGKGYVLI